jgi:hypothetical protein
LRADVRIRFRIPGELRGNAGSAPHTFRMRCRIRFRIPVELEEMRQKHVPSSTFNASP